MSWNRSSELGLLLAVAILVVGAAGVVSAVDSDQLGGPDEAEVGEEVVVQVEMTDLYSEGDQLYFGASTELADAEWTVVYWSDSEMLDTEEYSGDEFDAGEATSSGEDAPQSVTVSVTGTVPEPGAYSYEDGQPVEAMDLDGSDGSSTFDVGTWSIDSYTAESQSARTAIADARDAVDDADGDTSEAESTWDDAVAAYEDGDFDSAVSLAEEAESQAQSDAGSSGQDDSTDGSDDSTGASDDGTADGADGDASDADADDGEDEEDDGGIAFSTVLMYVVGLAVLVGLGGGLFYLSQQSKGPNRDPLGK